MVSSLLLLQIMLYTYIFAHMWESTYRINSEKQFLDSLIKVFAVSLSFNSYYPSIPVLDLFFQTFLTLCY